MVADTIAAGGGHEHHRDADDADFVAEISGVDLAQPLNTRRPRRHRGGDQPLCGRGFRGQKLSDAQQIISPRHFGPIHSSAQSARHTGIKHRLARTELADISNLDGDGNVLEADAKRRLDWLANRLWHTDASFRAVPGALSMLYAHVVPDEGGDTEFADMRAAYDALPDKTKAQIEGLIAEHSIWHSRGQLAVTDSTRRKSSAACRRCRSGWCARHPGSRRKTLYIAAHASHIDRHAGADGRLLLLDLIEHATQPRFVHSPHLEQGDLVIWDNRCTMHRARPFDTTKVRDLRRVTTRDVASTLEQAA